MNIKIIQLKSRTGCSPLDGAGRLGGMNDLALACHVLRFTHIFTVYCVLTGGGKKLKLLTYLFCCVQAEGVPSEFSIPVFINLESSGSNVFTQNYPVSLPTDVIDGSTRSRVKVTGTLNYRRTF